MLWHVTNSFVKLRTCTCSHTRYMQLLNHQRLAKLQLAQEQDMVTNTQHIRPFSSVNLQTLKYLSVLHSHAVLQSQDSLQARKTTTSIVWQHRYKSQYVSGAKYLEKLKENDEYCKGALRTGQFAVFYDLRAIVKEDSTSKRMKLVWRGADDMKEVLGLVDGIDITDAILLNSTSKDPSQPAKFAFNIPKGDDTLQQSLERLMEAETIGIRRAMFTFGRGDVHELLQAYALLQWHSLQAFCSKCGAKNRKNLAGNRRICSSCSQVHYPTMKPIVITLVTNGDRCLVARQPQFPPGMYSALAGFCDMGETLEDAVRREIAEEVGLQVEDITYFSSQHWPIPSSGLMLACYATVNGDDQIVIDKNELEDAKWMDREEVKSFLQQLQGQSSQGQKSWWFPPKSAIAHQLISGWAFMK